MVTQVQERLDTPETMAAVGSVRAWQHILNGCGYHPRIKLNGHLDEVTLKATKKFQSDLGLPDTGTIDLATWQAGLRHGKYPGWPVVVPAEDVQCRPAPSSLSESAKYEYYRNIIDTHNNKFKTGQNQRNLLGFRKETNVHANHGRGLYDDFLVMLWKTSSGQLCVREYKNFCTEPIGYYKDNGRGKRRSNPSRPAIGQDANGDGILDLGRISEGYYEYKSRPSQSPVLGYVLDPMQDMDCVRDVNDDGIFSEREPRKSAGRSILFHKGGYLGQGGYTWSAGCQTLQEDDFARFWQDLNSNGNPGVIGYTLVRMD